IPWSANRALGAPSRAVRPRGLATGACRVRALRPPWMLPPPAVASDHPGISTHGTPNASPAGEKFYGVVTRGDAIAAPHCPVWGVAAVGLSVVLQAPWWAVSGRLKRRR